MKPLDFVTVAVLGLVGVRLVSAARVAVSGPARRQSRAILSGLQLRHFLLAPPALAGVLAAAAALYTIPPLRFGWWTAIGGTGNIVTGGTTRTAGTAWEWLVPLVFLALLAPALPLFAEREELVFRQGAQHWTFWRRARRGVEFGLVHLIMGIPIAVALALSVGGWYFTWAYLRGYRRSKGDEEAAVLESTRSHVAYNGEILGLFALLVVGTLLSSCSVNNKPPVTSTITLTSTAFANGARIPDKYTCSGDDVSPPLAWSGVPINSAAVAIVLFDPDAPNGGFTHWVITGIDPGRTQLGEGERPAGVVEGTAGDGKAHYVGPCPPPGKPHHYQFTVYALKRPAAPSIDAIVANASSKGRLTGLFSR